MKHRNIPLDAVHKLRTYSVNRQRKGSVVDLVQVERNVREQTRGIDGMADDESMVKLGHGIMKHKQPEHDVMSGSEFMAL